MPDSTVQFFVRKKITFYLPLILVFVLSLVITGCHGGHSAAVIKKSVPTFTQITTETNRQLVNSILKTAFSQFGTPYRYGGSSPETGFDCSGFVSWVYKQYGINLPRSSRDMLSVGTPIERADLRPGDLVFFNYGYSHVGIYTGDDKYIHSPSTGKRIQESDLNGRGRKEHYVGARRIINNRGVTNISDSLKAEWVKQSRHQTTLAMNDRAATRVTGARANYTPKSTSSKSASNRSRSKNASAKRSSKSKTASAKTHKVASGDTMFDLAKRYGVSTSDLVAYNNMSNGNKLKPGQTIKIPSAAAKDTKKSSKGKASSKGKSKSSKK
ncbi:MAG: C40 family peptidase [Deltaproteobacteria bacterium]|nr:C40 family peptidase [Deltaproteobacteria bacterium]